MGLAAYLTVPGPVSAEELARVTAEVQAVGLDVGEADTDDRRISGTIEVAVVAVLVVPLLGFFQGLGEDAGKDAYRALKRLASRLRAIRGEEDGMLVLQDQGSGARIDLTPSLDDGAYRALLAIDSPFLEDQIYEWDPRSQRWV